MVEKLVQIGILFDFYGRLLSKRQYNIIELFYLQDLSLGEIGEELNITRQGVYDTLKRAEENLYRYEDTLGLVAKFNENHKIIKNILKCSKDIKKLSIENGYDEVIEKAELIENISLEILKDSWEEVID
ncbi:YlxM family DNA-binding protein [Tissierella praeacuta]|uniref:YlxM family DNA-binding protein n=1 Tax=Tissierella praeacuta TaxID=43131 RepID=UPI003518AC6E